jgi:hypothetical protein
LKTAETTAVARKKSNPEDWQISAIIFQLRGSQEYKAWLKGMADFDGTDLSELAERAFGAYARQIGYNEPRPKR